MNRPHTLVWFVTALVLLGLAKAGYAQDAKQDGKAIVRSVEGRCEYSKGGQWFSVKPNIELSPGTTLRTGVDSMAFINANGLMSAVRLNAETTLLLQKMTRTGSLRNGDTETVLELKRGTILGQVKKVSANSSYEIHTPNGTARIRGTDYMIEALPQSDGSFRVTFSSIRGQVLCSATVEGKTISKILYDGEFWTPGDKGNEHLRPPGLQGVGVSNAAPVSLSPQETKALKAMASDYNSFGFELLKATSKSYPNRNIFLSPLGAAFALSIVRSGARGDTQKEITTALRLDTLPKSGVDEANAKMLDFLSTLVGGLRLEIANGLWTDDRAPIKADFITNARNNYNGVVRSANLRKR